MVEELPPVGVISGPGFYNFFTHFFEPKTKKKIPFEEKMVHTPYGVCYARFGRIYGLDVVFISRHGEKESPERRPRHRANIWALTSVGVKRIISTSTGRSLNTDMLPGSIVLPDQYIDLTGTMHSFEGKPEPMDNPFCPELRTIAHNVGTSIGMKVVNKGNYVGIVGPAFETRAEVNMIKRMGGDIVGMSVVPEVKLAREMAMCYQPIVLMTRYEETKADIEAFEDGVSHAKRLQEDTVKLVTGIIAYMPRMRGCRCW